MLKKVVSLVTLTTVLFGCAMIQEYQAPTTGDVSKVTVSSDVEAPMLGHSTLVFKIKEFRKCYYGLNAEEDTRFMTLDKGNPLISEFNASGVNVRANETLTLAIEVIAGSAYSCPLFVGFTPDRNKDYEVKVFGKVNIEPHQCKTELWSTVKGTNKSVQESFEYINECLPN